MPRSFYAWRKLIRPEAYMGYTLKQSDPEQLGIKEFLKMIKRDFNILPLENAVVRTVQHDDLKFFIRNFLYIIG